jgi:hypothetical protein
MYTLHNTDVYVDQGRKPTKQMMTLVGFKSWFINLSCKCKLKCTAMVIVNDLRFKHKMSRELFHVKSGVRCVSDPGCFAIRIVTPGHFATKIIMDKFIRLSRKQGMQ